VDLQYFFGFGAFLSQSFARFIKCSSPILDCRQKQLMSQVSDAKRSGGEWSLGLSRPLASCFFP
jgi:hypothetical protein